MAELSDSPYRLIVVGFDGSPASHDALSLGAVLAKVGDGRLLVTYVSEHQPPFNRRSREYAQALRARIEPLLAGALASVPQGVRAEHNTLEASSPSRGLHELSLESRSDLLAIGSTHHGPVGRVLIGSVGELVVGGAPCPVTVAPRGFAEAGRDALQSICVGFDGSHESLAALSAAQSLASAAGAALRAVLVEPSGPFRRHDSQAQEQLEQAVAAHAAGAEPVVMQGNAAEALSEAASDCDMLVVGSRGYGPFRHVLMGSVSSKLMRSSPSPLLVVPRPALGEEKEGEAAGVPVEKGAQKERQQAG